MWRPQQLMPRHRCCRAGYARTRRDSCAGDSGGPLVWKRAGGVDQLIGVVSYGPAVACGAAGANLGAYTGLIRPPVLGWVNGELRKAAAAARAG